MKWMLLHRIESGTKSAWKVSSITKVGRNTGSNVVDQPEGYEFKEAIQVSRVTQAMHSEPAQTLTYGPRRAYRGASPVVGCEQAGG